MRTVAEMINGKVVLIGGTGFIMSHVAERYAQNGNEVVIFDNNLEQDLCEETRKLVDRHTNVVFVQGDVRDKNALAKTMRNAEAVYQLAALMGTSARFGHIEECLEACIRAACDSAVGKTTEIGSGINTRIIDVAKLIIELTGSTSKIEFLPMRTGEVKVHTKADLSAAKQYCGWEPKTSLREGLKKTIPYYARLLGM